MFTQKSTQSLRKRLRCCLLGEVSPEHKSCYKYCTNQRLAEVISRHLAHDDVAEDDVAIGRKADGIVKVLAVPFVLA